MKMNPKCPMCRDNDLTPFNGVENTWVCKENCNVTFSTDELVEIFNYDIGNFGDAPLHVTARVYNKSLDLLDTVSTEILVKDEGFWWTGQERKDAYEMVNRMFMDIPELERSLNQIDYGYPIHQVGT